MRLFQRRKAKVQTSTWEPTIRQPKLTRRYVEDSDYQLPKDLEEDKRLDLQHHVLFHALGNHYVAPINPKKVHTILDVGTGTGIWAAEMAKRFPQTLVAGLDLSSSSFRTPPVDNCYLGQGNVLTGLPFPDNFFTYTHQRLLVFAIQAHKWPGVIRELVRVTSPGGWVELVETTPEMKDVTGPATLKVQQFMEEINKSLGFDWSQIRHLGDLLIQEGLQDVEVQPIPIPVGNWAGRIGQMMKIDIISGTNALKERYCAIASIPGEIFDQMVKEMSDEWEVSQPSCVLYAAYGKKRMST